MLELQPLLLANQNCPHDLNGEVVALRQLVLIDALEHAMMDDFLLRVGGKTSVNMRLFVCKTVVFLSPPGNSTLPRIEKPPSGRGGRCLIEACSPGGRLPLADEQLLPWGSATAQTA